MYHYYRHARRVPYYSSWFASNILILASHVRISAHHIWFRLTLIVVRVEYALTMLPEGLVLVSQQLSLLPILITYGLLDNGSQ